MDETKLTCDAGSDRAYVLFRRENLLCERVELSLCEMKQPAEDLGLVPDANHPHSPNTRE
jgi:hypothetical protein